MSRYFTQLARHTGLDAPAPARSGWAARFAPTPPEQVGETIAPPPANQSLNTAWPMPGATAPPVAPPPQTRRREAAPNAPLTEQPAEIIQTQMAAPTQTADETPAQTAPRALEQEITVSTPPEPAAVPQREPEANNKEGRETKTPPPALELARPSAPAASSPAVSEIAAEPLDRDFFRETSALLEDGDATPEAIQQIYLREVREWVAVTPKPADETQIRQPANPPTRLEVNLETPAPYEVVVAEKPPQRPPTAPAEEQEYVVSIGSINVTIDAPAQPAPPPARTAPAARPAPSLRRYYL